MLGFKGYLDGMLEALRFHDHLRLSYSAKSVHFFNRRLSFLVRLTLALSRQSSALIFWCDHLRELFRDGENVTTLSKTHTIGDSDALDPGSFLDAPSGEPLSDLPAIVPNSIAAPPLTFGSLGDPSSSSSSSSGPTTSDVVTSAGSGIVFDNTFTANVNAAYKADILAAEADIQSHWSNSVTINLSFDAQAEGHNGDLASNSFDLVEGISYANLKAALIAHDGSNPDALAAVNSLPSVDPSGGVGWSLPIAYARMLGLTNVTETTDDTVTLNSSYYNLTSTGQDVIGTIEHEISEGGMGRIGELGKNTDNQGDVLWSTMDLFRYSSPGVRDYTDGKDGKAAYFSVNGNQMLLQFNNQYNGATRVNGGDTADYNALDVFGFGSPGTGLFLSATDISNMNVLGWTPTGTPPSLVADATMVAGIGLTQAIESSMLRFDDNTSSHAQETYSVITGPTHGTLLKNGVATTSFTQADIDNGLITYHEVGNFSSDSFTFKVTDSSNNTTTTEQFNFQIVSPTVVESFGSTDLNQVGTHFYLDNSSGVGPSLKYGGAGLCRG